MNPADYIWESAHNVKITLQLSDNLLLPRFLIVHFAIVLHISVRREREMGPALGLRVCACVEEMSGVSHEISFGLAEKKNSRQSIDIDYYQRLGMKGFVAAAAAVFQH